MFDTLIDDTQRFVQALARNNSRDWFQAHKGDYDAKLRDPARALLDEMSPRLTRLTGFEVTPKLFRANRDVRFSKDKTPYNTHLHMMWSVNAGARQDPALFFGINQTEMTVGTGIMAFDKDVLADWRKMVDLDGDFVAQRIKPVTDKGYSLGEPALKRVPAAYDKDHPHADLLRRKGLTAMGHPTITGDLIGPLEAAFAEMWPLSDMLIGMAEAPRL